MFKNFPGYKVLEKIQKNKSHKRERKLPLNAIKFIFIIAITLIIALLPTDSFGIEGLTAIHQRIIALFVFAALMWLTETMPSWVTSMVVVTVMLLTVSTSALTPYRTEKTTKAEALDIAYKKAINEKKNTLLIYRGILRIYGRIFTRIFTWFSPRNVSRNIRWPLLRNESVCRQSIYANFLYAELPFWRFLSLSTANF